MWATQQLQSSIQAQVTPCCQFSHDPLTISLHRTRLSPKRWKQKWCKAATLSLEWIWWSRASGPLPRLPRTMIYTLKSITTSSYSLIGRQPSPITIKTMEPQSGLKSRHPTRRQSRAILPSLEARSLVKKAPLLVTIWKSWSRSQQLKSIMFHRVPKGSKFKSCLRPSTSMEIYKASEIIISQHHKTQVSSKASM